jgi:hypothetical protein
MRAEPPAGRRAAWQRATACVPQARKSERYWAGRVARRVRDCVEHKRPLGFHEGSPAPTVPPRRQPPRADVPPTAVAAVPRPQDRYVFPFRLAVSKVSGAGEDSLFMGVTVPVEATLGQANVYVLQGGTVAAVDQVCPASHPQNGAPLGDAAGRRRTGRTYRVLPWLRGTLTRGGARSSARGCSARVMLSSLPALLRRPLWTGSVITWRTT